MKIEIDNLTKAQKLAIETMLARWQFCKNIGKSEEVVFYADGDGNFRPNIKVDGKEPEPYQLQNPDNPKKGKNAGREEEGKYWIDFDEIAWDLKGKKENKNQGDENA